MKVSGKTGGVGSAASVGGGKPSGNVQAAAVPSAPVVQGDALSVSSSAQFMAVARAALARIPDIRTEKVEAIKAKLDSDDYNPDGEAVADGLVREHTPPPVDSLT
jgi:negative regulator of flagellin synthesis FlgM